MLTIDDLWQNFPDMNVNLKSAPLRPRKGIRTILFYDLLLKI